MGRDIFIGRVMKTILAFGWALLIIFVSILAVPEEGKAEAPKRGIRTDLGTLGGDNSIATSINDLGQVVGWANTSPIVEGGITSVHTHAFLWDAAGAIRDLGALGAGTHSEATAINNVGQVVGYSNRDDPPECDPEFPSEMCLERHEKNTSHAFLWNGGLQDLGTLDNSNPYFGSAANDINDLGQVVGKATYIVTPFVSGRGHAFLWERGAMKDLGALPEHEDSTAIAINNAGQVVGISSDVSPGGLFLSMCPFIWDAPQGMRPLVSCALRVTPFDIDDLGQVVGSAVFPNSFARHAFIWDPVRGIRDLGTLGGEESEAHAIRAVCGMTQVVGSSQKMDRSWTGFIWNENQGMQELPRPTGESRFSVADINKKNQMVGLVSHDDPANNKIVSRAILFEWDSDCDGLLDDWEKNGIDWNNDGTIDIDLPAMGADRYHKDVFVEIDYMESPDHAHEPHSGALRAVIDAFSDAPVENPDRAMGINLHIDAGPNSLMNPRTGEVWGSLSRSNRITEMASLGRVGLFGNYDWVAFDDLKRIHFLDPTLELPTRTETFHYAIFVHNLGGLGGTSGISRNIGASDFIVSLGSWTDRVGSVNEQAGTLMHELGHNLGLRHGGIDHVNYKPNYLSVMNYAFMMGGLIINGTEEHFDYSRFAPPPPIDLNENDLNERVGLNGGAALNNYGTFWHCPDRRKKKIDVVNSPIDWNCNDVLTDNPTSADINQDRLRTILTGQNDWANIVYTGGAIGAKGEASLPMETPADELTWEEYQDLRLKPDLIMTQVSGPSSAAAGSNFIISDTVFNQVDRIASASAFDIGFYLSQDNVITVSDIFLGSRQVGGLDPQKSNSGTAVVTVSNNIPSGKYYLGAIASYNKLSSTALESDLTNNALAGNLITITPVAPTALFTEEAPEGQGGALLLTWTPSATPNTTEQRIYRSTVAGGPYTWIATLPGRTTDRYTDTGLAGGTTYYYVARAYDGTSESPDSNQASGKPVDHMVPMISAVTAGNITATEATLTWTTDEPSGSQVEYGTTSAYGKSSPIDSALVTDHGVPLTGLSPSTLYHYRVKSKDASGNLAVSPDFLLTTSGGLSDLAPTVLSATLSGANLTINDVVKNKGAADAGPFSIHFYLSLDTDLQDASDPFLCSREVAGLPAGASNPPTDTAATICPVPAGITAGSYRVLIFVDRGETVAEELENNNIMASGGTVNLRPDLTPVFVTAFPFGKIFIQDSVKNQGAINATAFTVGFYLSTDAMFQTTDQLICSRNVASLSPGAAHPSAGTIPTPCPVPAGIAVGDYYVIAVDDSADVIAESSEINNAVSTINRISIGPDLAFTDLTASRSGKDIVVNYQVMNRGTLSAGAFQIDFYLSTDNLFQKESDLFLCKQSAASMAAGALSPPTGTASTPCPIPAGIAAGSYWVIGFADSEKSVAKGVENNNARVSRTQVSIGP